MFQKSHRNDESKKGRGQGIAHVSSLFAKYVKILRAPQGSVIQACIDVIHTRFNIRITKEQCKYQVHSRTLVLHIGGPLKSEILLQKKEILNDLRSALGAQSAPQNIL